jgi:hypothetical protein
LKKTTMFVFAIMLCGASLYAAEPKIARFSGPSPSAAVPAEAAPAAMKVIFSNLGPSTDAYYDMNGWIVGGPASGLEQFIGLPFTPTANAHVYVVHAALQYESGANQVNVSVYSDSNGAPGTLLAGPATVKNLPTFGTCCTLAQAVFSAGVAVTAGTQYWIVADTPSTGTGSNFYGSWDFIYPAYLNAYNTGSGWNSFDEYTYWSAAAVYGTIP